MRPETLLTPQIEATQRTGLRPIRSAAQEPSTGKLRDYKIITRTVQEIQLTQDWLRDTSALFNRRGYHARNEYADTMAPNFSPDGAL